MKTKTHYSSIYIKLQYRFFLTVVFILLTCTDAKAQYDNAFDKEGLRKGKWIFYLKDGAYLTQPDSAGYYRIVNFKKGKPDGKIEDFNYRNIKIFEGYLTAFDPDTLNGPAVIYYDSGAKYEEIVYTNNNISGPVNMYFENGQLKFTCNYTNNLPDGSYNEYYENGQLHRTGNVIAGEKNGRFIFYTNTGDTDEVRTYKNNLQDGLASVFENKKISYELIYVDGKKHGIRTDYKDGVKEYSIYYKDRKMQIDSLIYLSSEYLTLHNPENALPVALLMEEYFRKVYPDNAEINDFAANTLAGIYSMQADTINAPYWLRKHYAYYITLIETEKEPDADHWHLLSLLSETFNMHAESAVAEKRAIAKSYEKGKPTELTLNYMQRMADIYLSEKNISQGLAVYDSILLLIDKNKKELGGSYTDLALAYANSLADYDEYDKATKLLGELRIRTKDTPEYYTVLFQLGKIDISRNKTDEANKVFTALYNAFGRESRDTSLQLEVLRELAEYNSNTGDYRSAEKLFLQLADLSKSKYADEGITTYYPDIADFYDKVGRYTKALKIREQVLAEDGQQLADKESLNYLWDSTLMKSLYVQHLLSYARTNDYAGNMSVAGENYTLAASLSLENFSDTSFNYMQSLAALAGWQMNNNNYAEAEKNYLKVISISEQFFSGIDVSYYTWLSDLAELYTRTKKYDEALALAEKVYAEESKNYAVASPSYIINCDRLASIYDAMGNAATAFSFYNKAMQARVNKIHADFSVMNENEREQYLATFRYTFDEFNYFALKNAGVIPAITADVMNYQLANKSALLFSAAAARRSFTTIPGTTQQNVYSEWLSLKQLINKYEPLTTMELEAEGVHIDSLQQKADKLEKQLTMQSDRQLSLKAYSWQQVKNSLNVGEAAVEFITIPDYSDPGINYNQYAALVIRYDDTLPHFIYLTDEDTLAYYLQKKMQESDAAYISRIYGYPEDESEQDMFTGQHLYRLVWEPITEKFENINKIFISPSGLLNKLNIAAIPISQTTYIADAYSVVTVSSLTELPEGLLNVKLDSRDQVALMGGIDYNASDNALSSAVKKAHYKSGTFDESIALADGDVRGGSWKYLPGSLLEVNTIAAMLQSKLFTCNVYDNANATEEVFKNFNGNTAPSVIHIASHGFFLSDSANVLLKNKSLQTDHSLFNSGILFAGGNRTWKGEVFSGDLEDGILTAAEVSNMDLDKCKLVVLSACETGLGEIKNDEGVFGLQRAFKLAGAENMIMSLWQVSDKETALFMKIFYTNWSGGKTLEDAFSSTQSELRKNYSPYYWAAFVLVE